MREINKISEALFEKIRDRFGEVSLGDENAKATSTPTDARFINFDYVVDGQNHGNITLSLIDEISLKVYFSKNISERLSDEERKKWYSFLRELREFSKRNMLSFEPRDITRTTLKHRDIAQVSKADGTYTANDVVAESKLHGTKRSSYQEYGPARIIVRHSGKIDPERRGDRSRKIKSIYLENSEGERFKLPHNNLRYARAMARHVSEGGMLNDEFGQHITSIAEECSKLKPFKYSMSRRVFEDEETQAMVEAAFEYHGLLNNTLKRISGRKGYHVCKETFHNDEQSMDDFDLDNMRERFVKRTYNDATDPALPIVQKAYKMKKENKFAQQFESWANQMVGEDWTPDYDDLLELLGDELPVGVDAINVIGALEGTSISKNEMFDDLVDELLVLAEQNPDEDARDTIMGWMQTEMPSEYQTLIASVADTNEGSTYGASGMDEPVVDEGWDDDEGAGVETIQSAIIRRILGNVSQHSELIKRAGPDGVMNAALDVASSHAPMQEIGSSDVSIMVREVYNEVGVPYPELNEGRMKDIAIDIEELSNKAFKAKYGKTKEEMKANLSESYGDDYVNKSEKLKRMGAKPLGMLDKLKSIPQGVRAMAKGDTEDDLAMYNKSKAVKEDGSDVVTQWGIPQDEWAELESAVDHALENVQSEEDWDSFVHNINGLDEPLQGAIEDGLGSQDREHFMSAILNALKAGKDLEGTEPRAAVSSLIWVLKKAKRDYNQLAEMRRLAGL